MRSLIVAILLAFMPIAPAFAAGRRAPPRSRAVVHRVQYGTASWYGARDQGRTMACGAPFNMYAMTAAHRTLPLGSKVRVTNLWNGRSVIVKIQDRGPHVRGRVIDLSRAAARRLGFTYRGLAPVQIKVVSLPHHHYGGRTAG